MIRAWRMPVIMEWVLRKATEINIEQRVMGFIGRRYVTYMRITFARRKMEVTMTVIIWSFPVHSMELRLLQRSPFHSMLRITRRKNWKELRITMNYAQLTVQYFVWIMH